MPSETAHSGTMTSRERVLAAFPRFRETWPNPGVRDWLDRKAVAIRVDAEEEVELAERFQIQRPRPVTRDFTCVVVWLATPTPHSPSVASTAGITVKTSRMPKTAPWDCT